MNKIKKAVFGGIVLAAIVVSMLGPVESAAAASDSDHSAGLGYPWAGLVDSDHPADPGFNWDQLFEKVWCPRLHKGNIF